jgi:hypothetical protein
VHSRITETGGKQEKQMTETRYYAQIETRKTGCTGVYENDMTNWFAIYEVGVADAIEFHKLPYEANRNSAETLRELGWELGGDLEYFAGLNVERGPVRRIDVRKRPDLRQVANPKKAAPETVAEIHASRCPECKGAGCPQCGYKGTPRTICPKHHVVDKRGGRAVELGTIPACEPITYGAWSEGAGGFVYTGDCATEVANWAADELRRLAKDDDTDTIQILAICPDHEEQPKDGCEECNTEDAEDEETEETEASTRFLVDPHTWLRRSY